MSSLTPKGHIVAEQTRLVEGSLQSASQRAKIAHDNILAIHNRLEQIPATLDVAWKGASASTYMQVLAEWTPQFRRVITALNSIADRLKETEVQYYEATTQASEVAARLRDQLNATAPPQPQA